MPIARRHKEWTRLTSRNVLDTLNVLIDKISTAIPSLGWMHRVKGPKDLYAFRKALESAVIEVPVQKVRATGTTPGADVRTENADVRKLLTNITTNAWRARRKMLDTDSGEVREDMRRVYRHVEAIFDSLDELGVEIRDMRGERYDPGLPLVVLSFEERDGLDREEVAETIKPGIKWRNEQLQIGEVVVGVPVAKQ